MGTHCESEHHVPEEVWQVLLILAQQGLTKKRTEPPTYGERFLSFTYLPSII